MSQMNTEWVPKAIDISDFKGIKLFRWRNQNRALVILHGPNGAGKTSILQAIQSGFAGDRLLPVKVIRDGAKDAIVRIEMDNDRGEKLIIERDAGLGRKGSLITHFTLRRVTPDGDLALKTPQSVLDELVDRLTLDPTVLYREKDAKRRLDMVQRCANLPPNTLRALDGDIEAAKAELKKAAAGEEMLLNQIKTIHQLNPDGFPDVAALEAKAAEQARICEDAEKRYEQWRFYRDRMEDIAKRRTSLANHRAYLERQIAELQAQLADCTAKLDDLIIEAARLIPPQGAEVTADELRGARYNATAAATIAAGAAGTASQAKLLEEASGKLSAAKAAIDAAKCTLSQARETRRRAIVDALNRAGLSEVVDLDDENQLLIYGRPWEDASGKERVLASAKVALATNPKIRILLLDEADSLGPEALETLREWGEQNRFIIMAAGVWITSDGAETIAIHEGEATFRETA
jgi:DNA repair exonuclease SbcCD ATPase subunit